MHLRNAQRLIAIQKMSVKILNLCSRCFDLVRDGFNIKFSHFEEHGVCDMCHSKGIVRRVRVDGGKDKEQPDYSVPEDGIS